MQKIHGDVWHIGDNGCSVFLVDTRSEQGLVLIDTGMDIEMIRSIETKGFSFSDIRHCILTHCHIDHIACGADLAAVLPDIRFYAHTLDAAPIEEPGHDSRTAASWYGTTYRPVSLFEKLTKKNQPISLGNIDFQCIHTPGHTPGSISVLVHSRGKMILFGQDIHGPFNPGFLSNLEDYQESMQILLDLNADILCEGHFGIYQPADTVRRYIQAYKDENLPKG